MLVSYCDYLQKRFSRFVCFYYSKTQVIVREVAKENNCNLCIINNMWKSGGYNVRVAWFTVRHKNNQGKLLFCVPSNIVPFLKVRSYNTYGSVISLIRLHHMCKTSTNKSILIIIKERWKVVSVPDMILRNRGLRPRSKHSEFSSWETQD